MARKYQEALHWKNLPNALTLARLLLCIPLLVCFEFGNYSACFILFLCQEFLDQADGKIAKAFHLETFTGRFFDPFADSFGHLLSFACFLSLGWLPLWMFLIILFRELGLMFLRLLGALQGKTNGGQWPGKFKAFIHALSLGIAWATLAQVVPLPHWIFPTFLAVALLSVFSGIFYLYGYRAILRKAFA